MDLRRYRPGMVGLQVAHPTPGDALEFGTGFIRIDREQRTGMTPE